MSFAEVLCPTGISYGSQRSPQFQTHETKLRSGAREPVAQWSYPLWRFEAKIGPKREADLLEFQEFLIARLGPFESFRWLDQMGYSTDPNADSVSSSPAFDDVVIAVGDGATTQFQLVMKYTSGLVTRTKNIYKPIDGTVLSGFGGVEKSEGSDWTLDDTTGLLTYATAPTLGQDVTWGGHYHLPCHFDISMDKGFFLSLDYFRSGSIPSIVVMEDYAPTIVTDAYFYGGSDDLAYSADISVTPLTGRAIRLVPASSGLLVMHPDTTDLETGGPWFLWHNDGAVSTILADAEGNTIGTLPAGVGAMTNLLDISGTKTWKGLVGT